ncbi:hypothetical protein FB480_11193 [Agrobacterium vitis]|nr:hypothetical protein FB480_11193 [Agrobacterium vitis]
MTGSGFDNQTEVLQQNLDELDKEVSTFYEKRDFDFSTVAGWREFLNERAQYGGSGADADGIQRRDFKYYAVGCENVFTKCAPIEVIIYIRTPGGTYLIPQGNLYVMYPGPNFEYQVTVFNLGGDGIDTSRSITVGALPDGKEAWGVIYYIFLKTDEIPGRKELSDKAKDILEESAKDMGKLIKRGRKLLSYGGATVAIRVAVQNDSPWDHMFPQRLMSDDAENKLEKLYEKTKDTLNFWD